MEENNQNTLPTEAEAAGKSCCGGCDKKSCWKWVFLVALLFLTVSLAYAGYQFSQFSKLSQKQAVISQPTPTLLPAEASAKEGDSTANWKTYTNKVLNISFKYPNEKTEIIECRESGNVYVTPLDRNYDPCQSSGGRFYIGPEKKNFNLPDWYYRDYQIKKESVFFGSKKADKYDGIRLSKEATPIPESFYLIAIPEETKTIVISVEHYPGAKTIDDVIIDQILSTFKFLE